MTISIQAYTLVLKKSAIQRHFEGGIPAFKIQYPAVIQDAYLFGIAVDSKQEVEMLIEQLSGKGLDITAMGALAHQAHGEITPNPHIKISREDSNELLAQLVDDNPEVLAEDGAALMRWMMRNETFVQIPRSSHLDDVE